jgi:TorA maturation chaperone TorD
LSESIFKELEDVSKSRQTFYSFLTRMFERELGDDLIKELQANTGSLVNMAPMRELGNKRLNEGLDHLDYYLKQSASTPPEKVKLELSVEYAGLFLSVWGRPAHPSESSYASGGKLIMQKERDEVMEIYKSVGLDKSKEFTEPDDHIAVELHFMSYLAGETFVAAQQKDLKKALELIEMQRKFLREHLGRWIGLLADDVVQQARVSFYKGIALLAAGFVDEDEKILADFVDDLKSSQ